MESSIVYNLLSGIPLLDGTNFLEWKEDMLDILQTDGLTAHINGSSVRPIAAAERIEWDMDDGRAKAYIRQRLDSYGRCLVRGNATAMEMWTTLQNTFQSTDGIHIYTLLARYESMKKIPSETIAEYITRNRRLADELRSIGEEIDDSRYIRRLLNGLPPIFHSFAQRAFMDPNATPASIDTRLRHEAEGLRNA
ncbi:hypothetical protein ABW19_dt0204430 [Dactylella cylindrospora]|nr:hypothetical protein ABW19_dt0204430 [Dactylella cylindrospora]